MKPLSRTIQPVERTTHGQGPILYQQYLDTGIHLPVSSPYFALYETRLIEYGFTEEAIEGAKKILGIESFGDRKIIIIGQYFWGEPTHYDDFLSYNALLLTKIKGRSSDPYAILDMLIETFNHFQSINCAFTLDQKYDYLEKWREEYYPFLGKNYYLDCYAYRLLYVEIDIFKNQFKGKEKSIPHGACYSINPNYECLPYLFCEDDSIFRTHPYFKDKIKMEMVKAGEEYIYKRLYKILKGWKDQIKSSFIKSNKDLRDPTKLRRVYENWNEFLDQHRISVYNEHKKVLGFRFHSDDYAFSTPNNIFPGIRVIYLQAEDGTITSEIIGKLEE